MLCALSVILMTVGAFVQVLDLSVAALASLLSVIVVIEIGGAYPWALWASTSVLGLVLPLPYKTPVFFYALFLGYYPILKAYFERLPRIISYVLKLVSLHVAMGLIYVSFRLFLPTELEDLGAGWLLLATYALVLICFVIYDYALTKIVTVYLYRFRKYIQRIWK